MNEQTDRQILINHSINKVVKQSVNEWMNERTNKNIFIAQSIRGSDGQSIPDRQTTKKATTCTKLFMKYIHF